VIHKDAERRCCCGPYRNLPVRKDEMNDGGTMSPLLWTLPAGRITALPKVCVFPLLFGRIGFMMGAAISVPGRISRVGSVNVPHLTAKAFDSQ